MKTFVYILKKKKDFTLEVVEQHVSYLRHLDEQGNLLLAGPFGDSKGGIVIVKAENEKMAHEIAQADPFITEGYEEFELHEIEIATKENDYLL